MNDEPIEPIADVEELSERIVDELSRQQDVFAEIPEILEKSCRFFGFDSGFIHQADHTGKLVKKEFVHPCGKYVSPEALEALSTALPATTRRLLGRVTPYLYYHRQATAMNFPEHKDDALDLFKVESLLFVPVYGQNDRLLGAVGMMNDGPCPPLDEKVLRQAILVLRIIANHVKMRIYYTHSEYAKRSLSFTLDNTGVDIYVVDFDTYEVLYVNRSMAEPYGGVENIVGRRCYQALYNGQTAACRHCPKYKMIDDQGRPTKIYSGDYQRPFGGGWFHVLSAAFPWVDGRTAHAVSSIDITENKRNEQKLWTQGEILKEAVRKANEGAQMKTAFLANMSHEIRTPLNSIVGMAELLSRNDLPGKTMEQILSIKQAGNHLLSIVNDVLDFSKIESGKLEVHEAPYQFASLINDVINIINIRLIDKGLVFTASIDPKIPSVMKGDEIRLRQVLLNVLGNAVKFTERGRIGLNISRRSGGSDEVVLIMEISDTGPGIGDEGMARLFDAFAQVDVHTRNAVEGTGLGLAITKSLVESMRGSITVRSELGRGSTFALEIPQGLLEDKPMVGGDGLASVSILLLEPDNVGATSFLQACLQLGLTCQRRNTPADMAETLSRERFTHVMIPYTCLNEALQAMYRTQSTAQLVVMTAFGELSRISGVKAVSLPVYALNLANVLTGNEESCRPTGGDLTTFVAPDSRVLVVDDIVTNLKVAEGLLSTYQLRIDTCTSGEAAIRHIKETDYDIVFMDHMMPGMDGIETVARIREKGEESSRCRDVTIIALTANVISGTREKFLAAGFNDFLAKPIEMSKMSAVLHKWLPRSKRIERSDKPLSTDQAPEIEGIDTLSGLRHSGGSLDRYMSVLRVYLSDGREISRRLEGGITNRDLALVELYAHSIKSASANIGAFDLSSRAGEIERTARSSESDFSWDEAKGVLENYHKLLGTVSRFIAARRDGGNSAPDIAPRLNELEEALSRFEMGRVDDIVQELMSCNFPEEVRSRLEKLEEEILISSYDSAKEQIAILKKELGIC